jgi:ribonuclease P protein subunit RPR2
MYPRSENYFYESNSKNFYCNIIIIELLGKQIARLLAQERISILIRNAFQKIDNDYELANSQAQIAKKISKRLRLKLPYNIRQLYCKKCKRFIVPGFNCRVRIGRSKIKALRITCLLCNNVYRKLL